MKIVQTLKPCAMCQLIFQLKDISDVDVAIYQNHLEKEHGMKPYFIPR